MILGLLLGAALGLFLGLFGLWLAVVLRWPRP